MFTQFFSFSPWQRHPDSAEPEKHPLTFPDGAQAPSDAGGWSLRFPGFQMDTPLSAIFSHGLFREQPTISSGPGPGGFHSWGLRPPASTVSRKDCGSVSGGKTVAGLPGLSGSFRPGFLQGGCAHGVDEKLVRIAQPALPAPRLRGWWAGLTAWRGIPGAEKIGLSWYKGKKHAQRPDTGGGDLRCYFTRPYSISVRLWQRITSFSWS